MLQYIEFTKNTKDYIINVRERIEVFVPVNGRYQIGEMKREMRKLKCNWTKI